MESINIKVCEQTHSTTSTSQEIFNYLQTEHSISEWRTVWGLPLSRLFQNNQNSTSITVVLCDGKSETNAVGVHQLPSMDVDIITTQLCALGHSVQTSNITCKYTDSPHLVIQLSSVLGFSDQLRFVCDCLLMITSPTFLKAMSDNTIKYFASDLKSHLLRLRLNEGPIAKRGLKFDCPQLRQMISGEDYLPGDAQLTRARAECRKLCRTFLDSSDALNAAESQSALKELIGSDTNSSMWMEAPVRFDYGFNTFIDSDVYMNYDCILLDTGLIRIKTGTKFGPAVHLYTASHPLEPALRLQRKDFNLPIEIGYDCWIGGHSVIVGGVRIGNGCTIAAGSIVTKDIPDGCIAAGVPAKIIRKVHYDHNEMAKLRSNIQDKQSSSLSQQLYINYLN